MLEQYTKYDYLFSNLRPNAIGGIKIFSRDDDFIIQQKYDAITDEEHGIWSRLFTKLINPLDRYACAEYINGLAALGLRQDKMPNFAELNPKIKEASGWELVPVAGFLDEYVFFELNANRKFPVTDIVRQSDRMDEKYSDGAIQNEDDYTPEPDVFHDVRGHVPMLMNKEYGDFLADIGILGHRILTDDEGLGPNLVAHNLKRLQNFAWWTYEFGIMEKQEGTDTLRKETNDMNHEIYGAGIMSSYAETLHVAACSKGENSYSEFFPYNIEEAVMTRFDYSEIQNRYFVIDSMDSLYKSFYDNQDLFWYKG